MCSDPNDEGNASKKPRVIWSVEMHQQFVNVSAALRTLHNACQHTHAPTRAHTYSQTHTCTHSLTHSRTPSHKHTFILTHTNTHTHTQYTTHTYMHAKAVNQLGVDKAVPRKILDIMGIGGLTRECTKHALDTVQGYKSNTAHVHRSHLGFGARYGHSGSYCGCTNCRRTLFGLMHFCT